MTEEKKFYPAELLDKDENFTEEGEAFVKSIIWFIECCQRAHVDPKEKIMVWIYHFTNEVRQ